MIAAILRWLFLLIADLTVFVLAWLLAPILPAFAIGKDHLPRWLSWFDTPDNPLDGDIGYMTLHAPYRGMQTGWRRYINRAWWLVRNPAYGFDYAVLGRQIDTMPVVVSGDPLVSDSRNIDTGRATGLSGHVYIRCGHVWEYYYVRQWGESATCLRMRLGWKLSGYINAPASHPLGSMAQYVLGIKLGGKFDT